MAVSTNKKSIYARRLLIAAGLLVGVAVLYYNLDRRPDFQTDINSDGIDVVFAEEPTKPKLSFAEYCRRNPVSTCWDNRQATDFLYDDADAQIAVIKSEQFVPELYEAEMAERSAFAKHVAELLKLNVESPQNRHYEEKYAELQKLNSDILEQLYEEELPEDVIENKPLHNPKLAELNIVPAHKPPYFGDKPVLAVVIDDMGISLKRTADIASLQAPLTVSFLTYGRKLDEQVENSRRAGQEVMIHVPMEAQKAVDAAPDVLTTQMSNEEIQNNLKVMLGKFQGIRGINNHMGSRLTEDKERMLAVMAVLKEQGLFFLDSKTSPKSTAETAAKESGIAYAHRHIFIDNNNDKDYILGQLAKAENVARRNGYAIAIGHPKTQTYAALKEWLPQLPEKGLVLMPLSRIVAELNPQFGK